MCENICEIIAHYQLDIHRNIWIKIIHSLDLQRGRIYIRSGFGMTSYILAF